MPDSRGIHRPVLNLTNLSGPDLIQQMRAMVQGEMAAQRTEFTRRMARPVAERVESGWCLAGLRWKRNDVQDASVAQFLLRDGNDSRLREGDYVRLSSAAGGDAVRQATIYREEADAIWLKLREGSAWDELWLMRDGQDCLVDADFLDLEPFYHRALDAVLQTSIGRECILPFLEHAGKEEAADFLDNHEQLADSQMNECQKDAVAECLAAAHCHLVQGPPGTGKTRALAEFVTRCVRAGEQVLVTSFTHRAIHHALDAVVNFMGEPERVVKIGAQVYAGGSAWRSYEQFRDSPLKDDPDGWVAGATPFAVQSRLKNVEFDRIIVDEAGLSPIASTWLSPAPAPRPSCWLPRRSQSSRPMAGKPRRMPLFSALSFNPPPVSIMDSNTDAQRRRQRLLAVKEIGKMLLNLKSRGYATTVLRESRVSAAGWPDFFVSGSGGRIACLAVCLDDGSQEGSGQLWSTEEMPGSLPHLAARLREVQQSWKAAHAATAVEPSLMILCPHWPEAALRKTWPAMQHEGALLAAKESCQAQRLPDVLERLPVSAVQETDITLLRAFLAPETILQPPLSPAERRRQSRAQQLSLLPQLLDYDQDHCAKLDLWLSDEGRDVAENFGLRLITGAAGTGKSVVLVHRAALLRQFHPQAKIAALTHNSASLH